MKSNFIDTNVIVRYLVENPETIQIKFQGVFTFFPKVERGDIRIELAELVVFEAYFVLTKLYEIPPKEVAEKLSVIVSFKGIIVPDKVLILSCLEILRKKKLDLVDAYILAYAKKKSIKGVYSFDRDLSKYGLNLLEIK